MIVDKTYGIGFVITLHCGEIEVLSVVDSDRYCAFLATITKNMQ